MNPTSLMCNLSHKDAFLNFIPDFLPTEYLSAPGSFSRNSKFTIKDTISFICTLVSSGLNGGIRQHLSHFLQNNSNVETIAASNACRTRYKIKSSAFEQIFKEVVDFVYQNWNSSDYQFANRNVIAVDGSKFSLDSSTELKDEFDEKSMNFENGSHYFPQCTVTTFYDVFRKIPIKRIVKPCASNERIDLVENLNALPKNSVIVVDRGYWGYEVFSHIIQKSTHDIVARMPVAGSFKEVNEFLKSENKETVITINPPQPFMKKWRKGETKIEIPTPITLRLIRYTPEGENEEIILATTLLDSTKYPSKEITELYWDRWQVELFYRDEKCFVEASKFHSKKKEGVLQELFASVLMAVVTRYHVYKEEKNSNLKGAPQFLNAITTLTRNLANFISLTPKKAIIHFKKIMAMICKIRYYYQKGRKAKPRITKAARNKWMKNRQCNVKVE